MHLPAALINVCVFVQQGVDLVSVFVVNFKIRPFEKCFSQQKRFMYGLMLNASSKISYCKRSCAGSLWKCALGISVY